MALPTSGTLTLADIQTEFGGSNPIGLSEYYAGGSYVPAGTSGTNGAVPSSGTISISDFYGTSAALDVQTVTIGLYTSKGGAWYGYGIAGGAISDGTFNPKGGASITRFEWASGGASLSFVLSGSHTNAGWTQVRIVNSGAGTDLTFTRASASYNNNGTATQWVWSGVSNPFAYNSPYTAVATFT